MNRNNNYKNTCFLSVTVTCLSIQDLNSFVLTSYLLKIRVTLKYIQLLSTLFKSCIVCPNSTWVASCMSIFPQTRRHTFPPQKVLTAVGKEVEKCARTFVVVTTIVSCPPDLPETSWTVKRPRREPFWQLKRAKRRKKLPNYMLA